MRATAWRSSAKPDAEMFGKERLVEVIEKEARNGATQMEYALGEAYENFVQGQTQIDDVTVMLVERTL